MNLDLELVHIKDVQFGEKTQVEDGVLTINKQEMLDFIANPYFVSIDADIVHPGEAVRIIPVKDVIEPRIKMSANGGSFPGFFGRFEECGEGMTKVLKGCAVVTTGTIVGFQEGIIDMSGPAADYCCYSKLHNIALIAETPPGVHPTEHETALRVLGLKAAYYLSLKTKEAKPDEIKNYHLPKLDKPLPKVAIVYMIMAQGLVHDNYLYGVDAKRLHPTLVHPNEVMDGALVNGTCVMACDKNTTYDHQNNPLVEELYMRHGVDIDFRGCIVVPTYTVLADKERCSASAIRIARMMDLDGVVIPVEGGGNPEADLMKMIKGCELNGIKTVGMMTAQGGAEGICDTTPEATALINTGCEELYLLLPPMERVIGHPEQVELLSGGFKGSLREDGSMKVSITAVMCATNQMGLTKLSSKVI